MYGIVFKAEESFLPHVTQRDKVSPENSTKASLIVITWAKNGTASIFPAVVKKVIKYLF